METNPGESRRPQQRLDLIDTQWSLLGRAHEPSEAMAEPARHALVLRYSGAIRAYVGALMRNDPDADEVAQEVLVRLLRGDFAQATPTRGRFRDLLKVAVRNMVRSFWQRQQRRAGVNLDVDQLAENEALAEPGDDKWLASWRRGVLDMSWRALEEFERTSTGSVSYTLLRLRADHPEDDTTALAARLNEATGRPWRIDAVRQQLRRARLRFAQLLLEELSRALDDPTPERIEQELIDVGLYEYVRDFLPDDWRTHGMLRSKD